MKFLFLFWIIIRGAFDAAVWATAVWCILCYFSNVLWLQCLGIFVAIHFIASMPLVGYLQNHTKRECLLYMRVESALVGLSILHGLILAPLLTVAAIVLLSVLQVWTNLETHWLHTLLFVACVVYNCSRTRGRRRLALLANTRSDQDQRPAGRGRMARVIDV
jgi:hypothetical protein